MMEDTTVTTNSTANQAVWTSAPKQPIFWGNQEAFANLEKFEQISNPTLDQDFNFDLEDSFTTEENTESDQTKSAENSILDVENIFESVAKAEPIEISKPEVAVSESVSEPESVLEPETPEIKEEVSEFKAPENVIQPQNEPATTTEFPEQTASTPQEVSRKEIPSQDIWSLNEDTIEIKKEVAIKSEPVSNNFPQQKQEQEKLTDNNKDQRITETKVETKHENKVETKHENKISENPKINNKEEKMENKEETAAQNEELAAHQKLEFEPTPESTQIIKKYFHLLNNISKILTTQENLTGKKTNEFSISTPTENETITYITSLEENSASLNIRKIIQKSGQEDEKHHLNFNLKSPKKNLIVTIDDFKLYEEEIDLTDASKALNVTNKFSKFEFLYREELSKLEDELEEKEKKKQTKVFSTIFHQF